MTKIDDSYVIPSQVINDCVSRFLMAQGDKILQDKIHFCSYLEQAFWFYIDMWVEEDGSVCKEVSFEKFVERVCEVTELPIPENLTAIELCLEFKDFKHKVNTYGGILINPELNKVLMVQCFNGRSWGFPKGKIEQRESFPECAIREVKEEIDYDMTPHINPELFLEATILEQKARLYIIHGVPEETIFKTNTRKEIGNIRWFSIDTLPLHRRDKKALSGLGYTPNNFFIVIPFVKMLKDHIAKVRENCLRLFDRPYFDQNMNYYEYLKHYYPEIYKIRMDHQRKRDEKYSISGDHKASATTSTSKASTKPANILDMLQSAKIRRQSQSPAIKETNEVHIPLSEVAMNTPPPVPPQLPSPLNRVVITASRSSTKKKKKSGSFVKTEPDETLVKTEESPKVKQELSQLEKAMDQSLNPSEDVTMNQSSNSAPAPMVNSLNTSAPLTQSYNTVPVGYPQSALNYSTPLYNSNYTPFGNPQSTNLQRPLYYQIASAINNVRNASNSAPYQYPYRNQLINYTPRPVGSNPGFLQNPYGTAYNQNLFMSAYRPQVSPNLPGGIIQPLPQNPLSGSMMQSLVQNTLGAPIIQPLVQSPLGGLVPNPFPVIPNCQRNITAPTNPNAFLTTPTNPIVTINPSYNWSTGLLNFNGILDAAMKEMTEGMQRLLTEKTTRKTSD